MDILQYNRDAWNHQVDKKDKWTIPVTKEEIELARNGIFSIVLTPTKPVPMEWFGKIKDAVVLCLASGGGQQVPIFAAAGAHVTSFDNSEKQLEQDTLVCSQNNLVVKTIQGDMRDLSVLEDASFDLIFHPCSNGFINDIIPVWKECFRVLKKGGILLSGFTNPFFYLFDQVKRDQNILEVKYSLPYSDIDSLTDDERKRYTDIKDPLVFSHTLTDQIGGQLNAGFHLVDFFEDTWSGKEIEDQYFSSFIATKAMKP